MLRLMFVLSLLLFAVHVNDRPNVFYSKPMHVQVKFKYEGHRVKATRANNNYYNYNIPADQCLDSEI